MPDQDLAHEPVETQDETPNGLVNRPRELGSVACATRVGTGASLHAVRIAAKGTWNRRFAEIYNGLSRGLLSEEEKQLARRAASLCVLAEKCEIKLADGKDLNEEQYKQLSDSIGRAFERLAACRERNVLRDESGQPTSLVREWAKTQSPERLRDLATEVIARGKPTLGPNGFCPPELAEFIEEKTGQKVEPCVPSLEISDPLESPEAQAALAELAKAL